MVSTVYLHCVTKDIPKGFKDKYKPGIQEAAKKWNVKLTKEDLDADYKYEGEVSTRFGNRNIGKNTKGNYETDFKQLWKFCLFTGDYESMLMLLSPSPKNAPSMKVETVESFLRFKRNDTGMPLKDTPDRNMLKDIFKNDIHCEGTWKAPKNTDIYCAAIVNLHIENDQIGAYEEACEDCRKKPLNKRHNGCEEHSGYPVLKRHGDPTKHKDFINCKSKAKSDPAYVEKGSSQLLVSDIRLIIRHQLPRGIIGLQTVCIILMAICLFLRHDEFHDIKLEEFLPDLFEIKDGNISALAIKVYGKADKKWVYLKLWADDEWTDIDPVRYLLIYLKLTGIKSGYLFPSAKELEAKPADGAYKTTVSYSTFMFQLKQICAEVLPKRADLKIGCQVWRKTGYLFGVFAQATNDNLMQAARHLTKKNAEKYWKDAQTQFETVQRENLENMQVGKWRSVLVQSVRNAQVVATYAGYEELSIAKLGEYFVSNCLGISKTHRRANDMLYLIGVAAKYRSTETPKEQFNNFLKKLKDEEAQQCRYFVAKVMAEESEKKKKRARDESNGEKEYLPPTASRVQTRVNKTPRQDLDDLEERHSLKDTKTMEDKMEIIKKLWEAKPKAYSDLTAQAQDFYKKSASPIMSCLETHFNNDLSRFCERWRDTFFHTTFKVKCCDGKLAGCSSHSSRSK